MKTIFSIYFIFCAAFVLNAQHEKKYPNSNSSTNSQTNSNSTVESKKEEVFSLESRDNKISTNSKAYASALSQFKFNYNLMQINTDRKSFNEGEVSVLNKQLEVLKKYDAEGFEYAFNYYLAGNFDTDRYSFLKKAEKLQPKNNQVMEELLGYHLLMGNSAEVDKYYNSLIKRNHFSKAVLDYAKDVAQCIPNNAIVITHGEKDTYPVYKALKAKAKNVTLVNLDFLTSETYRDLLKRKGVKLPNGSKIDTKYFNELCTLNTKVYVAMSLPQSYLREVKNKVNTYGLLYAYNQAENGVENGVLWKSMSKDILKEDASLALRLSANYIPVLISYYKVADEQIQKELKESLRKILKGIGKEEKLDKILDVE